MVETMHQILNSLNVTVHSATLQAPDKPEQVKIKPPEEVFEKAKAFFESGKDCCNGWLCFTDKVVIVPDEFDFSSGADRIILSGELARGKESLHIRQAGSEWLLVPLTRQDGGDMLMVEEKYLPIRGSRKLCYETYWKKQKNDDGLVAYRPYAARFSGFDQGGKQP